MSLQEIMNRLESLERQVAEIQSKFSPPYLGDPRTQHPWWRETEGVFRDDPDFEAAVKLGRKYRDSDKPAPRKKKRKP